MSILRQRMPERGELRAFHTTSVLRSRLVWSIYADILIRAPSLFLIEPIYALGILLIAALVSALFNPIQDCDETFNFWEPTHYLVHGYGLQTWEWSPEYGIRDWLYILPHALVAILRWFSPQATKVWTCSDKSRPQFGPC